MQEIKLTKISFKSIFKLLFFPFFVLGIINIISASTYSDQFNVQINSVISHLNSVDASYVANISTDTMLKIMYCYLIFSYLSLTLVISIWIWFVLKLYFLFFTLTIRISQASEAHDQTADPAVDTTQVPDKT